MAFFETNVDQLLINSLEKAYIATLLQDRPFMDAIPKEGGISGNAKKVPFSAGYGGGVGGDFASALANALSGGATRYSWLVVPAITYGIETLQNQEVAYTEGGNSAESILTDATFGAAEIASKNFAKMIFGDGFGTLATIASNTNPSGTLYRLVVTVPTDISGIDIGSRLVSKAAPNSASLDAGSALVVGNSPLDGALLVDAQATGWTPTNGHVIGLQGQMLASATISTFPGIFAFCPPITLRTGGNTQVVGDTFLGVTRDASNATVSVSGWALDGRGQALKTSIGTLAGFMANYKHSKPTMAVMNPTQLDILAKQVDAQVRYDMEAVTEGAAGIFFDGFYFMTPAGRIKAMGDPQHPANLVTLTNPDDWRFEHPGKSPFGPTSLKGSLMVEDYSTNVTRISVACTGFFYTVNVASTGVITIDLPTS
jgi:hypothetical protein